jgi:hypothetical protein
MADQRAAAARVCHATVRMTLVVTGAYVAFLANVTLMESPTTRPSGTAAELGWSLLLD